MRVKAKLRQLRFQQRVLPEFFAASLDSVFLPDGEPAYNGSLYLI